MTNIHTKPASFTILTRALAVVASVWAMGVTICIIASPAAMTTIVSANGQNGTIMEISWFEYAGFYGTVLLLLWTGLFVWGAWAAWLGKTAVLAFIAIGTLIFSWLTLLSLGGGYLPAALALSAALILHVWQKRRTA
jgi:hypothetical protein